MGILQFNVKNLYELFKNLYTLTNIRVVLVDSEFNELLAYPKSRIGFCAVIRKNIAENAECVGNDKNSCMRCAERKEAIIYRCHAGLTEGVLPIVSGSVILGYIMFGQIIQAEKESEVRKRLEKQYTEARFRGITKEFDRIPVKTEEEISSTVMILKALTNYALSNHIVTMGKSEFVEKLDEYIDANMEESISVDDISREFHIGRTRLYSISNSYLGVTLAKYIRERRIERAKYLLGETDMPISEITYEVGFSDYNHFARTFRKNCGMPARKYRNLHRK